MIVDNKFQHTLRSSDFVDVPPNGTVSDILKEIKAKGWDALKINEAKEELVVWRLCTPVSSEEIYKPDYLKDLERRPVPEVEVDMDVEEEEEEGGRGKGKGKAKAKVKAKVKVKADAWPFGPDRAISLLFEEPAPDNMIRVLVQVPPRGTCCIIPFPHPPSRHSDHILNNQRYHCGRANCSRPGNLKAYQGISIVAHEWGSFQFADFEPNDVKRAASAPDFVTKFEQELDKRSGVTADVRC